MKQTVKNITENNLLVDGKSQAPESIFEIDSSLFSPFFHEVVETEEKETTVDKKKKKVE